jgi:hypothetical protein
MSSRTCYRYRIEKHQESSAILSIRKEMPVLEDPSMELLYHLLGELSVRTNLN